MSTEQQLAGLPEDSLPANSQMKGIRIGGAWRLGFLLLCQENDPPGHRSRIFKGVHLQQLVFPNLGFLLYLPVIFFVYFNSLYVLKQLGRVLKDSFLEQEYHM